MEILGVSVNVFDLGLVSAYEFAEHRYKFDIEVRYRNTQTDGDAEIVEIIEIGSSSVTHTHGVVHNGEAVRYQHTDNLEKGTRVRFSYYMRQGSRQTRVVSWTWVAGDPTSSSSLRGARITSLSAQPTFLGQDAQSGRRSYGFDITITYEKDDETMLSECYLNGVAREYTSGLTVHTSSIHNLQGMTATDYFVSTIEAGATLEFVYEIFPNGNKARRRWTEGSAAATSSPSPSSSSASSQSSMQSSSLSSDSSSSSSSTSSSSSSVSPSSSSSSSSSRSLSSSSSSSPSSSSESSLSSSSLSSSSSSPSSESSSSSSLSSSSQSSSSSSSSSLYSSSSSSSKAPSDCGEKLYEWDKVINKAITAMSTAVDGRNKLVQRLDTLRTMKAEIGLEWLDARVKYSQAKGEIEKRLVEGAASGAVEWLKEHGPVMAFFMVLTSILTASTTFWIKVVGYMIKSFRLGMLVRAIYDGINDLMADAFGPAVANLHQIRVQLDEYKNEIDKYYDENERIIKFMWPEVAEAKEKFDKEYAKLIIIEQTIKSIHDLSVMDAIRLLNQIYDTLENLERLGNDWIEKLNKYMDKAISLVEAALWVLCAKLNVMRSQIEDMMRKREQDYQDCLSKGLLPDGTWHRPMPEFMIGSDGCIIGVFQGS